MSKKYHVNLAFADDAGRTRSITLNTARKVVTAPLIREALRELEMGENSTLLSVSWLGKMSEKEYVDGVTPMTAMRLLSLLQWAIVPGCIVYFIYQAMTQSPLKTPPISGFFVYHIFRSCSHTNKIC